MPEIAKIIEESVITEIFYFKKKYPKTAKKIVCVWIIKLAFATVVLYIEKTDPQKPNDKIKPPRNPGNPKYPSTPPFNPAGENLTDFSLKKI